MPRTTVTISVPRHLEHGGNCVRIKTEGKYSPSSIGLGGHASLVLPEDGATLSVFSGEVAVYPFSISTCGKDVLVDGIRIPRVLGLKTTLGVRVTRSIFPLW